MYSVSLFNANIETVVHYPSTDKETPHTDKLNLKEGLSQVDSLSFVLYPNNLGYNEVSELSTKVKVTDTRDNTMRYTGRVLDVNESMDSNGLFCKEITCEGALSYLNDSKQRANAFLTINPTLFLTEILAIHNGKVDISKQILVGNVDVVGNVAYSCNFETTLASILTVKEKIGGEIRVREENNILYMDWLQSFSVNTVDVNLGENMKDMIKDKDVTSLGTRIVPLGANNLTIASINGGIDYIEDTVALATYGVVEKTIEYKDIIDATELYNTCFADLDKYTQPLLLLESNALDLSYLTGNKAEQFTLGTNLHLYNPVMAIDSIYKVMQIDLDLLKAYDPKLTIANFPVKSSTQINDLRKSSIQKESVSNGVQIGNSFGIRIASTDGKTVTTLNATEGISIEDKIRNLKVFYVDIDGNIVHDGKQQTTSDGQILIENYKNINGGLTQIFDNNGNLNAKVGCENGTGANKGGTLILYNDNLYLPRVELGISTDYGAGVINLKDNNGVARIAIYADSNVGNGIFVLNSSGSVRSYLTETSGKINNSEIATTDMLPDLSGYATQSWVTANFAPKA